MNPNQLNGTPVGGGFDQAMQQAAQQQSQQQQAQPAAPQHSGNWFSHLLPTIGSVALPALGALLAPETGGLSLIAAAGLSGAGAAAGKAGENAVEGKDLGNGVVGEGIMGGVGGAAGGVAGKFLGKAAGALGGRAETIAADTAAQNAATDGIETAANTYKDISPQLQKVYNAKDSLAHTTNMGYDIADPSNLVHVGNTSNDILNDTLNRALANSGPVDLSHYPQIIKDALAKESGTLGSYEPVAVARGRLGASNTPAAKVLAQLEQLGNAPGETTGSAIAKINADPNELRTLTTKLGQLAQDAKPSISATTGAVDPQQRAIYNVMNDVRGQVKDSLYNRPSVTDALSGEVGNIVPDAEKNITPQLADHLNNVITGANDPQALLSEMSRNINIGKLGEEGQKVGNIVTSTGGKARAAAEAGLDNPGPDTNPLLAAASTVSPSAGIVGNAVNFGKHAASNPAILSTLSRIGAMGAKLAPAAGAVVGTSPGLAADPVNAPAGTNGTMGGTMNGQPSQNDLANYIHAMEAQSILGTSFSAPVTSLMSNLAPMIQQNQLLHSQLGGLQGLYGNAGGPQGIGGILSHITGLIPGTAAHTYEAQQADIAHKLGINPALLPGLMQNQQTAGMSGGILSNMGGQLAY